MADFDIAISFAGEDRVIAKQIAVELKNKNLIVFYDDDEQADLLGENLTEYLIDIYKNKSSYCLVLISSHYIRKRWTRHEWRAAQARAFEEFDKSYILPVRIDDSELPGLLPTVGYLSLKTKSIKEIADIIVKKIEKSAELNKAFRKAGAYYKIGEFDHAIDLLQDKRFEALIEKDYSAIRLLSDLNLASGRIEKAKNLFHKLLNVFPNDSDSWFLLGVCYFRLGKFHESIKYYKKAIELSPNNIAAYIDLVSARRSKWFENLPFLRKYILSNVPTRKAQKLMRKYQKNLGSKIKV